MKATMKAAALAVALGLGAQMQAMAAGAPAGEARSYTKTTTGTFKLGSAIRMYEDEFPATVIYASDGKVYFKNLISTFPEEYYIEGTISGNTITVPVPQMVIEDGGDGYGVGFGVLKTVPRIEGGDVVYDFEYAPDVESIKFEIAADGSMDMVLPGKPFDGETPPEYVAGFYYTDDYGFTGYSDFEQHYTKLELELITIPEGAEVKQYVYIDSYEYASIVDVAIHEGYLYIRGLSGMLPEGTIKAKIDGNKAVVAQNQYLGIYYDLYYIFTKVLYANPDYDETDPESVPFFFAPSDVGFVLNIDEDGKLIYADTPGVYLSFHCDEQDFLNSLGYYEEFELKYQDTFAGTPANPVDLEYTTEWAPQQGFNDFFFTLSNHSTAGTLLDVEKLYYKVIADGEPVVFLQEEMENLNGDIVTVYQGVPVMVNLLPYMFNNNEDIFKFFDNAFDIGLYFDVHKTIGVQSVYYYEGEFTYSDIVTLDIETGEVTTESGVETTTAEPKAIATEYYTVDGRRVPRPASGIFIERTLMDNGATVTRKVAR